jgi:predicted MFS family arabinose efflux permease
MVLIYKLEGRRKNILYITIGVMMVGLSFLLLNIPFAAVAVASSMIVMVTFGEILSMPFMNSYWIARTQPSNRGEYAAIYTMAWSAAQTLGPMGGAQLAEHYSFNLLWWIVGGVCIFASLSFWKLHQAD